MTTLTDVTTRPASGLTHIDALLDRGPGWNWLTPGRDTLRYTFSLAAVHASDIGTIYSGGTSPFNGAQQSAVGLALSRLTEITGIRFELTTDASTADLHLRNADLLSASFAGYASTSWNYSYNSSQIVTAYSADAWIYLDNAEYAAGNGSPSPGTEGYEVLLHELGHALGLKHPFEDSTRLPDDEDNTAYTLMSYTDEGGPHDDYSPYDIAALTYLYGGDGLGGSLGHGSAGVYLVGSAGGDVIAGGNGDDRFEGGAGNDRIDGGAGSDTAVFNAARGQYTVALLNGSVRVVGPDGDDTLFSVERLLFNDQTLLVGSVINGSGGNDTLAGTAAADTLNGLAGNDRITAGGGDDLIDGGSGIDTAVFSRSRADHVLQRQGDGSLTVQASAGTDGRDTLTGIERLAFSDQSLAFDLDGHAGTTARYLGAVFGRAAVANKAYAGIGLSHLDGGTSAAALMQLALDARMGPGFTRSSLVDLLYFNLVGSLPGAADQAHWVGTLASGQYTPVTLAQMAAGLDLNAQNIDLVGLASSGLAFV